MNEPTRVYIAGPMSGMPGLNFAAFFAVAQLYRRRGCVVVNPAELHPEAPDEVGQMTKEQQLEHWRKCMRVDLREMLTCDMVVMLDGWTASRGATLEHHVAHSLGLAVVWHK
jgi:nucleoside 2-deoxyribosyltransferase